ncbi:hypothetical protein HDV04_000974 [Boothiomyces sp. JEL0838]|nr:hypothetical protein HDV04_000974 [Boothiomyces sp. JEL0838]
MLQDQNIQDDITLWIIQIAIQIIIFLVTGTFAIYSYFSPAFKKKSYDNKTKSLIITSLITQTNLLVYFNAPFNDPTFSLITKLIFFALFLVVAICEWDFLRKISSISACRKETISKLQTVWILWSLLAGCLPIILIFISNVFPLPDNVFNWREISSLIYDLSCVIMEFTLSAIAIKSIHSFILAKYSKNKDEDNNYRIASKNFHRLIYLTIGIVCLNSTCVLLYILGIITTDIYVSLLLNNLSQVLINLGPSLIAFRFLLRQSCIFPSDGYEEKDAKGNVKSFGVFSLARTRKIDAADKGGS